MTAQTTETTASQAWEDAYAQREQGRRSPTGFFAVTGLYWLSTEPAEAPGIPGTWSATADAVVVDLGESGALAREGEQLTGAQEFAGIPERAGILLEVPQGQSGDLGVTSLEVAKRGGLFILRPKSASHPFLSEYAGTERFDYNPNWRITATYEPFEQAEPVTVAAAVEGIEHVYQAPGRVRFEAERQQYELLTFDGFAEGERLVLFTDHTSGDTTYHALRALRFAVGSGEPAEVVVDFNNATNLPCAYTDLATCPLPPKGNRIEAAVTAGEKKPRQRVESAAEGPGMTWQRIITD